MLRRLFEKLGLARRASKYQRGFPPLVTLTPRAIARIDEIIEEVGLSPSRCHVRVGFRDERHKKVIARMFMLDLTEAPNADDFRVSGYKFSVVVAPQHAAHVHGVVIDYPPGNPPYGFAFKPAW